MWFLFLTLVLVGLNVVTLARIDLNGFYPMLLAKSMALVFKRHLKQVIKLIFSVTKFMIKNFRKSQGWVKLKFFILSKTV
jgi:hypothetical protein